MIKRDGYICGPTVHDTPHLGNLKTFYHGISHFKKNYPKKRLVMNITDIGDKIYQKAQTKNIPPNLVINFYTKKFIRILKLIGLKPETIDFHRASFHLKKIKKDIKKIMSLDFWSTIVDDTGVRGVSIRNYNNWTSHSEISDMSERSRDFCLWRGHKTYNFFKFGYNDRTIEGIPGWHNQCATLVDLFMKDAFVHYGSIDLKSIHHKNQSDIFNSLNKKEVNWVYIQPIMVKKEKLSKSLKNYKALWFEVPKGWSYIRKWLESRSINKKTNLDIVELENYGVEQKNICLRRTNHKIKHIKKYCLKRENLKKRKLYDLADYYRALLNKEGFLIRDHKGFKLFRIINNILRLYDEI